MFIAPGLGSPICETIINKVLTLLGFLHICLQPYFCHVINSSLTKSCKYKDRYNVIKRLCLIGGFLLFSRHFLSYIPALNTMDVSDYKSTEWLRGDQLCTFKTEAMWHLGWSVPMADPSYYVVGASIHSFLMFAPFFVLYEKKGMVLQAIFLFLIRETLIIHWGKNISVFDSKKKEVKVSETCRDFVNCEYCKADKARLAKATKNGKNGTHKD